MPIRKADEREKKLIRQLREYKGKLSLLLTVEKMAVLRQLAHQRADYAEAQKWAERIIKTATKKKISQLTDSDEVRRVVVTLRDAYTYRGREHFESFLIAMDWNRPAEERFYEPRKSVLKVVVDKMQDLSDGKIEVLGVSMPPRAGKSTLGLLYIVWRAGRNPHKSILSAGYSSSLVSSFYDGCVEFITSSEYRFLDVFPESPLVSSSAKNQTLDLASRRRYKTLTFRSIDGTVTGATEASELLYLDDLVSGIEEAMNPNRLEGLWSKVSSDMLQRKKNGVQSLIIGTRWSVHDPLGKIETNYEGNEKACFIRLPAIDEKGESNFDYKYGVGFSTEYYSDLKRLTDTVTWECVYMQNPIERDGLLFPTLQRFLELPKDPPDDILAFVDVAFGGADYLSMPIAYQWGEDVYVVDTVFLKGGYKITQPIVTGKIKAHGVRRIVFEANNGGDFYARDIKDMLKDENIHCDIKSIRAQGRDGKLSRIIQHSPAVKEWYFRDSSLYRSDEMYGVMMNQLLTYVQTGKSKHDDAPDSMAGLARMIRKRAVIVPTFSDRRVVGL